MLIVPDRRADGTRRYGAWAGNPDGHPEDTDKCTAEIPRPGRSMLYQQCSRRRGHGPDGEFCKQHARMAER